jgi:hypothetical protein
VKYEDHDIILLENYPCNSRNELHAREAFYIKNDGKLICVSRNCRLEIDPLLIMWNCILCKKDFKTGGSD